MEERNLLKLQNDQYRTIIQTQKEVIQHLHLSLKHSQYSASNYNTQQMGGSLPPRRHSNGSNGIIPTSSTSAIETLEPVKFINEPDMRESLGSTELVRKKRRKRLQENQSPSRASSALSTKLNTKQKSVSVERRHHRDYASYQ